MNQEEQKARLRAVAGWIRNVADTVEQGGGNDGWAYEEADALLAGRLRGALEYADAEWQAYA